MGIKSYNSHVPYGYTEVYYDTVTGQYMQANPDYLSFGYGQPKYIPINNIGGIFGAGYGQTSYTPQTVDFNALPSQIPTGIQVYGGGTAATPYQRPTQPTAPTGTGYRPQFDPSFIQQMLAARTTRPTGPATISPASTQIHRGNQGQGGLAALRAIANPAPVTSEGK